MASQDDSIHNTDFRIDHNGRWYHAGQPIAREALARLFAMRALKIDAAGQYWLQSPHEKYPVQVEDVPFLITRASEHGDTVDLMTNMDEHVALGHDNRLELRYNRYYGIKLPYVHIRQGLYARLGRNVYYDLTFRHGSQFFSRGALQILGEDEEAKGS